MPETQPAPTASPETHLAEPFEPQGRVVVITGGEGDLARVLQQHLAAAGYEVLAPGRAQLDVSDPASVQAFFKQAPRVGLLINNAGVTLDALMTRMDPADWHRALQVNLDGAWRCGKAALRGLLKSPGGFGHILHIGSYSGLAGNVGQANYAASKAGLLGLTRAMAQEYGAKGLRVNCVLPGYLKTKMTAGVSPAAEQRSREKHVLGRFNTPDQAARFIVLLDAMVHVSGQHFQLDSRLSPWA